MGRRGESTETVCVGVLCSAGLKKHYMKFAIHQKRLSDLFPLTGECLLTLTVLCFSRRVVKVNVHFSNGIWVDSEVVALSDQALKSAI